MSTEIAKLLNAKKGHFLLESGHHGQLWLDLELLCLHPERIRPIASQLAHRLATLKPDAVCGPLVEGAFVALMVAEELNIKFFYSVRIDHPESDALYSAEYRVPQTLRKKIQGRRVVIVNDVINAGSAVRATWNDLQSCQANTVGIGALLVLGSWAPQFSKDNHLALEAIESMPNLLWTPSECPLCAAGEPLENMGDFQSPPTTSDDKTSPRP